MKITINCPSYRRPKVETLTYLPGCRVWVAKGEAPAYRKANRGAEIVEVPDRVQGNLCRVRNWILDRSFADRSVDAVCIIDDDMKGMYYWRACERMEVPGRAWPAFLEKYTVMAGDLGAKLWGVNVAYDKQFYREYTPFSTVSYIGGPFMTFLRGGACRFDERLSLKEDYDMTLQQLATYRVVLRVNKFFYRVKQAKQTGGCASYRTYDREREQIEVLMRKWGREIVRMDQAHRNHIMLKVKAQIDFNPIIVAPIKGI